MKKPAKISASSLLSGVSYFVKAAGLRISVILLRQLQNDAYSYILIGFSPDTHKIRVVKKLPTPQPIRQCPGQLVTLISAPDSRPTRHRNNRNVVAILSPLIVVSYKPKNGVDDGT